MHLDCWVFPSYFTSNLMTLEPGKHCSQWVGALAPIKSVSLACRVVGWMEGSIRLGNWWCLPVFLSRLFRALKLGWFLSSVRIPKYNSTHQQPFDGKCLKAISHWCFCPSSCTPQGTLAVVFGTETPQWYSFTAFTCVSPEYFLPEPWFYPA